MNKRGRYALLVTLIFLGLSLVGPPKRVAFARTLALASCSTASTPCDFKATAARTKGRVDLSWRYTGQKFTGSFLVERSTDGKAWIMMAECTERNPTAKSYTCANTGLTSGRTYQYRACGVAGSLKRCGTTNRTAALSVKAP